MLARERERERESLAALAVCTNRSKCLRHAKKSSKNLAHKTAPGACGSPAIHAHRAAGRPERRARMAPLENLHLRLVRLRFAEDFANLIFSLHRISEPSHVGYNEFVDRRLIDELVKEMALSLFLDPLADRIALRSAESRCALALHLWYGDAMLVHLLVHASDASKTDSLVALRGSEAMPLGGILLHRSVRLTWRKAPRLVQQDILPHARRHRDPCSPRCSPSRRRRHPSLQARAGLTCARRTAPPSPAAARRSVRGVC